MGWFRRRASGRHALGAAVTSIPSGPLAVPVAPSVPPTPPPPVLPADDLYGSIVQLLATGEPLWTPPPTLQVVSPAVSPERPEARDGSGAPAVPLAAAPPSAPGSPAAEALPPVVPEAVPAAVSSAVSAQAPPAAPASARSSLEAALAQLLPLQAGAPAEEPQQLRVQLGFRDGTSTTLDPASSQAQALEQLAQSLTRRD